MTGAAIYCGLKFASYDASKDGNHTGNQWDGPGMGIFIWIKNHKRIYQM